MTPSASLELRAEMSEGAKYMVAEAGREGIDRVEDLWGSLVEAHRDVIDGAWPVRSAPDAWSRRRAQYETWIADGSGTLLLAVPADDPGGPTAGYAMVTVHPAGPSWDLGDRVGELETLVVAEDARGTGVGTLLIRAARDLLREKGAKFWSVAVVEANDGATRLYEHEGFRPYYRSMLAEIDE